MSVLFLLSSLGCGVLLGAAVYSHDASWVLGAGWCAAQSRTSFSGGERCQNKMRCFHVQVSAVKRGPLAALERTAGSSHFQQLLPLVFNWRSPRVPQLILTAWTEIFRCAFRGFSSSGVRRGGGGEGLLALPAPKWGIRSLVKLWQAQPTSVSLMGQFCCEMSPNLQQKLFMVGFSRIHEAGRLALASGLFCFVFDFKLPTALLKIRFTGTSTWSWMIRCFIYSLCVGIESCSFFN